MRHRPPRGELFENETAGVVYSAFLALDPADQHRVLYELQRKVASPNHQRANQTQRVQEAIRALSEAFQLRGESPSVKQFEALRKAHPDYGWPPATSIKRWLGVSTWSDALNRARLPTTPVGDALEVEIGPRFTADELVAALQEAAKELGRVPSFNEYYAWAHRPDIRRRTGRRPLSANAFVRLFGSFQATIIAAGLAANEQSAVITADGRLRAARYRVDEDEIAKALRAVACRLGRSPRTGEYITEREVIYRKTEKQGHPRVLPAYGTIARHFARWDHALVAAGLAPVGRRETKARGGAWTGPRHSDATIKEALRAAYEATGEPFTQRAYEAWRRRQISNDPRRAGQLPSANAIGRRFGRWNQTKQVLLNEEANDVR